MDAEPSSRLDEFDENEWFDICRKVRPDLGREEFAAMWSEFQRQKEERKRTESCLQ